MDESAIRMWAWQQASKFTVADGDSLQQRMKWADWIAAWAMSGKRIEPAE